MSVQEEEKGEEQGKSRQFGIRRGKEAQNPEDWEQEEFEAQRIDDDAEVDVAEEAEASAADEILERLDRELVGLEPVKTRIREIADFLVSTVCGAGSASSRRRPRSTCRSPGARARARRRWPSEWPSCSRGLATWPRATWST